MNERRRGPLATLLSAACLFRIGNAWVCGGLVDRGGRAPAVLVAGVVGGVALLAQRPRFAHSAVLDARHADRPVHPGEAR